MIRTEELFLLLFSLNLGIAFGAGIYEARIIIPRWFSKVKAVYSVNRSEMQLLDTGRKFWAFVTTMPLTLLTIANLILALQSDSDMKSFWMIAVIITLAERITTFTFFIPTIIRLQNSGVDGGEVLHKKISSWIYVNYLRNACTLAAWLLTVFTLMSA